MEQGVFPFNFFSLKTSLNASLSSLWECQISGKLRKKSYVRGSLLSGQIGFNFLLARVMVPRDCTTCCVWPESRIRGTGFHLGDFSTQDILWREQTIHHLSWRRRNSYVREIFCFRPTPKLNAGWAHLTNTQCCPQVSVLCGTASRGAALPHQADLPPAFPRGLALGRRKRQSSVETLRTPQDSVLL